LDITNQIQTHTLNHLLNNEDYCRRVIPFIKKEYYAGEHAIVFELIVKFVGAHNKLPTGKILDLELQKLSLPHEQLNSAAVLINELKTRSDIDTDYLINETEKWCKEKAVYNAIMESIQIIDGKTEKSDGAIPEILSEALGTSFDQAIGHDYIDNSEDRYDFYNRKEDKIPFDLDYMNKITKGGLPNKTLNIALAGTGVGKSLFMCHCAASNLQLSKNVLYITMEMAEERIAERIDANLMDYPIQSLSTLPKNVYTTKIEKIAKASVGKLIVKEYPTGAAHTGHFRALLNELKLKKNFKPDIIYIDYLNTYPLCSATQTTRSGFGNTDVGLEDTSESFGLPATADLMFALISTEELDDLGQIMVKQLKNRYNDLTKYKRFVIGIDRSRMKLYDVEESAQTDIMSDMIPDKPINNFGDRDSKDTFADFKI
jgi:hypothetical protein